MAVGLVGVPRSGTVNIALSTSLADMVSRMRRRDACIATPRSDAWNRATGLPGNTSLLTSQSSAFLNEPGIPRAYSGEEISRPSEMAISPRQSATRSEEHTAELQSRL